jgi:prepilin-type N-terminal cleavage/methylation domain-containing protein
MRMELRMLNQKGFTLIEIIAVLVIMSILAAAGMQKMESLSDSASKQTLNNAVRDLNSKEALTWALVKVSEEGWVSDESLFAKINANLGEGYSWSPGPVLKGGTLRMRSSAVTMARTPSTANTAGNWEIK